jgi:hypothetical protein
LKEAEEIFVIVSENLIASSERRLTFNPEELSEQLDHTKPINNEPPERVKTRLAVAESQGSECFRADYCLQRLDAS